MVLKTQKSLTVVARDCVNYEILFGYACFGRFFAVVDEVFDEFCGGECEVFDFGHDVIPLFVIWRLFFEVFVEFECCDNECGDRCHSNLLCSWLFAFVEETGVFGDCVDENCDWVHS